MARLASSLERGNTTFHLTDRYLHSLARMGRVEDRERASKGRESSKKTKSWKKKEKIRLFFFYFCNSNVNSWEYN